MGCFGPVFILGSLFNCIEEILALYDTVVAFICVIRVCALDSLHHSNSRFFFQIQIPGNFLIWPGLSSIRPIFSPQVPSEKIMRAGKVLRDAILSRAPHIIRDRKYHLKTYRQCCVGTELVDWQMQQSSCVHSRIQAVGMWQVLLEEGVLNHVDQELTFQDKYLFYRFLDDEQDDAPLPTEKEARESDEELQETLLLLSQIGPDAHMRMILRKQPGQRTADDLEIMYEELLHIKALSHLSTTVKKELAGVLIFESHAKAGTVLFNQGEEGTSWYIILKGSVNVVIYGKGVVCTLHEGDDFGKLALVNDAPRAASIVLREDNCHFLRVDKEDFNRILKDVEANTVRLKEHYQDVLVLEKSPSSQASTHGSTTTTATSSHYKYTVMSGTPEKILEHFLEMMRLDSHLNESGRVVKQMLNYRTVLLSQTGICSGSDGIEEYTTSVTGFINKCIEDVVPTVTVPMKCFERLVMTHINTIIPETLDPLQVAYCTNRSTDDAITIALHTSLSHLDKRNTYLRMLFIDYSSAFNTIVPSKLINKLRTLGLNTSLFGKRARQNLFPLRRLKRFGMGPQILKRTCIVLSPHAVLFKVYCSDHTYTTIRVPMAASVREVISAVADKLGSAEDLLLVNLSSAGDKVVLKPNDISVFSTLSINGRLFVCPGDQLDSLMPLPEQEGPSTGSLGSFELMSSKDLAYQMTLYDWELFHCVHEHELIYYTFGRKNFKKTTANMDLFLRRFNEIQLWVITEICLCAQLSKRVQLLKKFIKIAAHCKEYKNLNSFFAIIMGMSNPAVSRLSQTWEKLPSKFKKFYSEFESLMDPSRNHRAYRLTVAKLDPPIIPFMPLLIKDMTFTHDGNKTFIDSLVNFEKMRMIANTVRIVRYCRSLPFSAEPSQTSKNHLDVRSYVRQLTVIDNQRTLSQFSHRLEPRRT
ncbi:unnamed protein product [Oncorhynchus mykiss]|uniref:Rap guanine nucleotide exchange factor 4 n=1 Tax=Oncorhynchus mykiss TaxID=8022 RepID=A0A060VXW2_ONCMY|nr:unnamed protein product [Oncorhynchus mykiss]